MLYVFHPITGVGIGENDGMMDLNFKLALASLMHQADDEHLKVIIPDFNFYRNVLIKSFE